ncbi:MAG: C25 family cysteine peptidase, partial [Candidatus Hermodarchaeota archaeon]|nr:C25 family cysteine peptidase [Candidatus Hermodarchaeota archaeon]
MQREIGLIVLLLLFQTIFLPPHIILVHEFGFQSPQLPQKPIPQIIDTSVPHIEYTKQMRHVANSSWVPFVTSIPAGTPPDIRIIYSDMHKMVIRARFYGMWNWSTSPGGTAYNSIEIPFTGMLTRVSAPELPFVTRYVEIPYGVTVTSSILHEESNCTLLQSNYFILPHKGPWYPTNGTFPLIPTQDPTIYSMNAFWPALNFTDTGASVSDALVIRGRRILALNFVPITFNPQLRKLRAYNELLVQLAYDRPTSLQALNPQLESPVYTDLLNKFLLNPRTSNISNPIPMRATRSSLQSGIASKYLIITVEAFRDQVKRLKDWKDTKGIPTEIITVESLPDYPFDTEDEKRTAIYNAIHHAYHNRASAPDYVLLVGDSEHIPPYYKMDHTSIEYGNLPIGTDLFYFTVDGSGILPDILYGRLSANTPQQLRAMVDKILNYSKTPPLGVSFYSPVSAISTIIDDDEFNEIRIRLSEKLEDHVSVEYCNDATEINDSLNAGRFMAYYIGHGDSMNQNGYGEGWRHDAYLSYTTEEAATLDIHHFDFEYPVLFSMSCNTGWFDGETDKDSLFKIVSDHSYECFCENLTRMDQRGPVAMFGATRVSELSYNYILMQGFLDALYPDFDPTMPNAEGYTLGQLLYYGKLYMTHYYGITEPQTGDSLQNLNRTHMTLQMYHLFGDPEMSLATSMMPLYVSYETTMGIGSGQGFIVHVETGSETPIGGATVCLQKGSEVYAVDRTNIFGDVVFKFDDVTLTPGKMNVTVTKQGYAPHIGETEFYPFTGSISVDPRFGLGGSEVYLTIE